MRKIYLVFILFFSCFFLSSISQSQTITIGTISPASYCAGSTISIPFTVSASFNNVNIFIAQLSNASGSFSSPLQIGLLSTDTSGILLGTIPTSATQGSAYRIRVISSTPSDTSNVSIPLTINPLPAIAGTITGTAMLCQGQNPFTYKVAVINNAATYVWTLPSGASGISTTDSIIVSYSLTAVSGNIMVKGNNACGDGIASTLMIIVNPTPDIPIALSSVSYCQNSPASPLSVTGSNLLWYTASTGGIGSTSVPTISTSITGTTNYFVTQTNSFGCESARKQIDVIINTLPVANYSISPITAQCSGTSISFTNSSSNATNYNWRFGDRLTSTIASPNHIFDTIGNGSNTFTIWLTAISQYGCKDSISHTVTVTQRPDPSLKSDGSGGFENSPPIGTPTVMKKCALLPPNTLALTNIFSPIPSYSTLSSDSIYDITFGTGTPSTWTGNPFSPLPHDFPLGSYTLIYKVTGKNKCVSSRQYQVYAGTNPGGGINLPPGTTLQCAPQTYNFPLSNNVFNNTPSTQYTLSFNDGTPNFVYDQSQMQLPPFFYDSLDATWKYPHTFNTGSCGKASTLYSNSFYIKLNINNACAEAPSEAQPIVLRSKPTAGFSFSSGPYCVSPSNVILTDTSMGTCNIYYDAAVAGKYVSYASLNQSWTITPSTYQIVSGTLTSSPLTVRFTQVGNYTIKYVSSGNNQCGNDSVTKTICVSPLPVPGFTMNKNIFCLPDTVKITDTTNTSFFCTTAVYNWNISCTNTGCDGSNCNTGYTYINSTTSASKNPEIKFTKPGIYSLSLTMNNSCATVTSSIRTITVKDKPTANFTLPASVCMNANICPTAVSVTNCYGTSALSYLWSSVLGVFTNPSAQTPGCVSASALGTQTVTLAINNECGITTVNKSLTVNPLPTLTQLSNIIVCPGDIIPTQTFTSNPSGASFAWTNSNTNIGKPVSGNGNITSWTAPANITGINVVGTITVTPTLAGCPGTPMIFTVTIKPTPLTNVVSNLYFCPGDSIPLQSFTSTPSGASFTWTNTNTAIGIGSSGSVNIPAWIAPVNAGTSNISGTISVTPSLNTCVGNAMNYTINVYPTPSVNAISNTSVCPGSSISIGSFVSTPPGATFSWTNTNTAIGLASSGNGNIASWFASANISGSDYTSTITVTPLLNGCSGIPRSFVITVKSKPVLTAIVSQTVCSGQTTSAVNLNSNISGTTYNWSSVVSGSVTPLPGSGILNPIPATVFVNNNSTAAVITYTIIPTANLCVGSSGNYTVTVNPAPIIVTQPLSSTVCLGGNPTQLAVTYANGSGSANYQWYSNSANNTTSGSSIGGATTSTYTPPATTAGITYYYCILTFSTGGCANITSNTAMVDVKADPAINSQPISSQSICVGGAVPALSVLYTAGTGTPTYQWYSNTTSSTTGGTIILSATNASYLPPTFLTTGNYYYYLTLSVSGSGCDATTSNIALVTVVADPVIDTQAVASQSLCQNAVPANLQISVSGGVGSYTYQWYSNTINSNSGGSLINLATSASYTPPTTTIGTKYYYCVVTQSAAGCSVVSAVSAVIINSAPIFTLQPYSSDTCQGLVFAPISVNYSNGTGPPSYQWYSNLLSTTLGGTAIVGAVTNNYTPPSASAGTIYYYCIISFGSGGCSSITSNIVSKIVHPKPIAAYSYTPVTGGQPLNVSFTNLSTTQPLSNLWSFGYNFPNLTNQNPVVSLTNTGIVDSLYTIRLIVTSTFGCKDTVVHTVNVHPLPITKFGAPNVCFGLTTPFSDSSVNTIGVINNWHWSFGDGDTSNLQNPAHYYLNTGTYSVSLTTTNNLNISNSLTKNIIVYPLPVPNYTTTYDTLGCVSPATVSFTNSSTGAQTYKWNFGDNSSVTTFNASHIFATTGYYFVKLIDTTQFKCVDSIQHRIRIISSPVANCHLSVSDSCGPLSVTFTNQSTGMYLSYLWNFNIGTPSTSVLPGPFTKVYPAGANDSVFYVSLKATNICGIKFYYDTITVFSKPKCNFGMNQNTGCSPLTISFLDTIIGHPDSLVWNFGDGSPKIHSSVFSQNIFHTFTYTGANDTTYYIKLIAYNECGSDSIIKPLIVSRNTTNAFFNTDTLFGCKPLTVHFTSYSQGASHYNWSFGDGNFSNQPTIAHTYSQPGVYITYLAVANECSKDTFWSSPITVYPSPIVGFIYSGNQCTYDSVSFTSVTPGLSQYSWNFGDGGQSNLYNPKHLFNNYGNFTVKLIGYSINGCRDTSTQIVNIKFTPTSKMNIVKRIDCSPLITNIVNQTDNLNLNNYNWILGNGNTYVSTQPPTQTFINSSFCNDTFIQIKLVSEYLGCYDTITDSVRVLPIPLSKFSLQDSCDFGFNSLVQTVNQSVCASAYAWKLNGSQVSVQTNPIIPIPNPGYFTIQQIAYNLFQCKDTSEIVFHLYQSPYTSITMDTNNICEPYPATAISFSANIDSIQYRWNFGDGISAIGQNVNHIYNQAGNYTVHINISGLGGCVDSSQLTTIVHIHPRAKANFSFLNNSLPYPDLWRVNFTNTSLNSSIWNWTFGDGNSSTDENPSHSYPGKDSYHVTLAVNNSFNCPGDTAMWIQLNELWGLFIPSAFSPGNINPDIAYFKAYGDGLLEFNLEVYDTWGNKLWGTSELIDKKPIGFWDGTVNGKPMPSDTYVWKVSARFIDGNPWFGMKQADGKYKTYGTITIIR